MDLDLKDKVIMIAAASQGIGYGIAEAAAREGARLSLCSRSREKIEQAAATLRDQFGVDARGYVCDAGDNNDIRITAQSTAAIDTSPPGRSGFSVSARYR